MMVSKRSISIKTQNIYLKLGEPNVLDLMVKNDVIADKAEHRMPDGTLCVHTFKNSITRKKLPNLSKQIPSQGITLEITKIKKYFIKCNPPSLKPRLLRK